MQFRQMSEQEWRDLPFWQRVNRRALGLIVFTSGLLFVLFLPIILGVIGDVLFGDPGAITGIVLGFLAWLWAGAALVEGAR